MQQRDAPCQMIENEYGRRGTKCRLWNPRLRHGPARQLFKESHDVIAGNTDEPAGERQAFYLGLCDRCTLQCGAQRIEILIPGLWMGINTVTDS